MTKLNNMIDDTDLFVATMKKKYDINVSIVFGGKNAEEGTVSLAVLADEAFKAMCSYDNKLKKYESLRARTRKREFIVWVQCFYEIAHRQGHTYSAIARELYKNHASILLSSKKVQDLLYIKDKQITTVYNHLTKHYIEHVGILPESLER